MLKHLVALLTFGASSIFALEGSFEVTDFSDQRIIDFYKTGNELFSDWSEEDESDDDLENTPYYKYIFENFPENVAVKVDQGTTLPFEFDIDDELFEMQEPKEPLMLTLNQDLYFRVNKEEKEIQFSFDLEKWESGLMGYSFDVLPILSEDLKPCFSADPERFTYEDFLEAMRQGIQEGLEEFLQDYYIIRK